LIKREKVKSHFDIKNSITDQKASMAFSPRHTFKSLGGTILGLRNEIFSPITQLGFSEEYEIRTLTLNAYN